MASSTLTIVALFSATVGFPTSGPEESRPADIEFFEKRIRPVLVKHCFECHSEDSDRIEGDLRLDRRLTNVKPLIVAGNPDASRLMEAIRYTNSDLQMPPSERLPANVIADFESWIRMGAADPRPAVADTPESPTIDLETGRAFWAFRPIRTEPPVTAPLDWGSSPIDAFVAKRLADKSLSPSREATRQTLVRRVSLVLTGLPPTTRMVNEFVGDSSPLAFQRLVDRLLASPDYSERWARHWLDVVRYGDCNGADESRPFPNAWHFRNYIIDSFNRDVPYDRLLTEHLAGDFLTIEDGAAYEPLVGTGFLVLGTKILAEQDTAKMGADIIDEQIDTFGRAFLALTLGCARCHDHKFDPIPTADYYGLAGIFKSTMTMKAPGQWVERSAHSGRSLRAAQTFATTLSEKQAELNALDAEFAKALDDPQTTVIEAESFARGTVSVETTNYGKEIGVVGNRPEGGESYAEYDIEVERPGHLVVQLRYAAATARPGRLLLNGKVVREPAITESTGGWYPQHQKWCFEGVHPVAAGKNVIRFDSKPVMSHIDKLRYLVIDSDSKLLSVIAKRAAIDAELADLKKQSQPPYQVMAVQDGAIANAKVHIRGDHLREGDEIPRRFLQVIAGTADVQPPPPAKTSGRLELAKWLTRPDHPLTSRVMVNRLWRWHFGRGIVSSTDNFGQQGTVPSHPRLLDYLARRLIDREWSLKAMHREIVSSDTWKMSSRDDAHLSNVQPSPADPQIVDPENRLLWRSPRRRLEAEVIRDSLLAVSDRLDRRHLGAPLSLKTIALSPEDLAKQQTYYESSNRRSIYLPVLRTNVFDFLTLLDFANPDLPTGSRVTTTVPTQALMMTNSPFVRDCAERMANSVLQRDELTDVARVHAATLTLYARSATAGEVRVAEEFLNDYLALREDIADLSERRKTAWTALCQTLITANDFVYLK